jgi:aldehyde:ferredoxin oxidoreductase
MNRESGMPCVPRPIVTDKKREDSRSKSNPHLEGGTIVTLYGYAGQMLRIDLSEGKFSKEPLEADFVRQFIGGVGFGAHYLYREHPRKVEWSDPQNRIIIANGPLSNTPVGGSGTMCVVAKGPMTNLATSSQANGYWGGFLKSCGYDGIILQGKAPRWSYLGIGPDHLEIKDASHLVGKDTQETQRQIQKELGAPEGKLSVYCIGPAAERGVRFAMIIGDGSHTPSKNGLGAVMASKNLKAVAIGRGNFRTPLADEESLRKVARELHAKALEYLDGSRHKWGTNGTFSNLAAAGALPVKNYTTNLFPEHEKMSGQYVRTHFERIERIPCLNCGIHHNLRMKVTEGPYRGFVGEEPELEVFTGLGSQLGITDAGAIFVLLDEVDRLGLDVNETGWVLGWVMECYEKGLLTRKDTDGIEMNWGNVESARQMIRKIAQREGIGDLLAEGVKRAAEKIGGEAVHLGVYTKKGSTPRGHDHRARWAEHLDTCFTNTSTLEATFAGTRPNLLGLPPVYSNFSPWEVPAINARTNGWHMIEDCMGVCRFNMTVPQLVTEAYNAATGAQISLGEIVRRGRRMVNLLRVFNFKNGLTKEMEAPSTRYGSAPVDGPAKGMGLGQHWPLIQEIYYRMMGWDPRTGKPTPETLRELDLADLIPDLGES